MQLVCDRVSRVSERYSDTNDSILCGPADAARDWLNAGNGLRAWLAGSVISRMA